MSIFSNYSHFKSCSSWFPVIHIFRKEFDSQTNGFEQSTFGFILFFQSTDRCHSILNSCMSIPSSVVAWWVWVVKLEAHHLIESSIHKADSVRSAASKLSHNMLAISNRFHYFFNVNRSTHSVKILLTIEPASVYQVIGISDNPWYSNHDVLIHFVKLSRFSKWHEQWWRFFLFSCQYNT